MKRVHCLRVETGAEAFESLFVAAAASKVRLGWLDWASSTEQPGEPLQSSGSGVERSEGKPWRQVEVSLGKIRSLKQLSGPPVFRDVLRENFRGCLVVFVQAVDGVHGEVDAPRIIPLGDGGFEIQGEAGSLRVDPAALIDRLRRPDPWSTI